MTFNIVLANTLDRLVSRLLRTKLALTLGRCMLTLLGRCVRRDHALVLCGAINGRWYGDNSKYVYEWILARHPDLTPVWMTNNHRVFLALKAEGKPVAKIRSLHGVCLLLRASTGIFTNSLHDIALSPFLIPDQLRLIALRHGRSVKRVRFARKNHKITPQEEKERQRESLLVSYAISTSDFVSEIQEECLKIGRNKHVVTGYPRNDLLHIPEPSEVSAWHTFMGAMLNKKTILYAPSWRHGRNHTRFFPFGDFSAQQLVSFLEQHNCVLLLRPHANDLIKFPELVRFLSSLEQSSPLIKMASHHIFPDANSLLPFADVLISDYSAIYHDYLLLNRPMLFIPYDLAEFEHLNGFLYDYLSSLPGPAINSQAELVTALTQILSGNDAFEQQRLALRDRIHTYQDMHARERVTQLIKQMSTA